MVLLAREFDPRPARRSHAPTGLGTLAALLLTLVLCGGCGPTIDEIAVAGVVSTPIAYVLAVLGLWAVHGLWRRRLGSVSPAWPAIAAVLTVFCMLALLGVSSSDFDPELVPASAMFISSVAVALTMVIGRLRLDRDPAKVSAAVPAIVVGSLLAPYLVGWWLGKGPTEELLVMGETMLVILAGSYIAPPIILGVVVESLWSRSRGAGGRLDDDKWRDVW